MYLTYSKIKQDINARYPITVDGEALDFPFVEDRLDLEDPLFTPEENAAGYSIILTSRIGDQAYSKYYIKINLLHPDATDATLSSTLCHEYGHFVLDFSIYPRFKLAKKYLSHIDYDDYWNKKLIDRTYIIINEFLAWCVGYYFLLFRYKVFKLQAIMYGFKCFAKWFKVLNLHLNKKV